MERIFEAFGLVITCVFIAMGFFMGEQWLIGCIPGFAMSGFGLLFDKE